MKPTNLWLLDPKTIVPGIFKEVSSTDSFEGMTQNLNEEGLYSLDIFGKQGSKERDKTEAYIDTKLGIFNPTYFKALVQLKSLYGGIIKGSEYAEWDPVAKDFIKSNLLDGETGFSFFMQHFKELDPPTTDSFKRSQKIELIDKNKDKAITSKVIVIPAGLRDVQFDPEGVVTEPEISELYRKLLFRTRVVSIGNEQDSDNPLYDNVRWSLQNGFNEIDDYFFNQLGGKGGHYQKRVGTRGVALSARNVITARKVSRPFLFVDNGVNPNSADIGLYQSLLNFRYHCTFGVLSKYISQIFTQGSPTAKLVNKKTLEYEYVEVDSQVVEKWTSATGINKLFNGYANVHLRNKEILINGHYLALVYDDGKDVCVLSDINDLPEGKDRKYVKGITYMELFYLSCHKIIAEQMSQQTRYPIIGIGSIFPAEVNLLTIAGAGPRIIRDSSWESIETCMRYPHRTEKPDYFDGMSVDPTREKGLDSDHDGDALTSNCVGGEDSKAQVRELFGKREYYISGSGRFLYDPVNEPIQFMLKAATSGLNQPA